MVSDPDHSDRPQPDIALVSPDLAHLTCETMIVAALARGRSTLRSPADTDETRCLADGLRTFGAEIRFDTDACRLTIGGQGGYWPTEEAEIDCGRHVLTLHLLTAAATLAQGQYRLAALFDNPGAIRALADALTDLGASLDLEISGNDVTVNVGSSALLGGRTMLAAAAPPEALAALLLIAPHARNDVFITATGNPLVDPTESVMTAFGAEVIRDRHHFIIPAPNPYQPRNASLGPCPE
jgi:3-phosphoshikimate 1-carboxyvinyltransferase